MEVKTIVPSTIILVKPDDGTAYGNRVYLLHDDGYLSMYAHLKDVSRLVQGQHLKQHEYFATIGKTGYCPSGEHLHFSLFEPNTPKLYAQYTVDPFPYIERLGYPTDTEITNYFGSSIHGKGLTGHEGIDFSNWRIRES